jgi:hypothetical protein
MFRKLLLDPHCKVLKGNTGTVHRISPSMAATLEIDLAKFIAPQQLSKMVCRHQLSNWLRDLYHLLSSAGLESGVR